MNYLRPDSGKYLILESFTNTVHKTIHVVNFDNSIVQNNKPLEFIVGRENEVNIRITDISVSRFHAKIIFLNDNFYIQDSESKFGTLVLLQAPCPIPYGLNSSITLQLGRYLSKALYLIRLNLYYSNN